MAIPFAIIVKLILVINYLMNGHLPHLDDIIIEDRVNYTALQDVENILTQMRRDDVLEIVHQTRAGKEPKVIKSRNFKHYNSNNFKSDLSTYLRPIQTGRDLATRREFSVFNDI
jgi:hypothetical protein